MLRVLAGIVALVVLAAGCADPAAPAGTGPADAASSATQGPVLLVSAVDDEYRPVPQARVFVDDWGPVLTNANGTAEVANVDAGTHAIKVEALGYYPTQRMVDVPADEAVRAEVTLERQIVKSPYIELVIYEGFDSCALAYGLNNYGLGGACPDRPQAEFRHNLTDSWKYGVWELDWEGTEAMRLSAAAGPYCPTEDTPCLGIDVNQAPLRLDAAPNHAELAAATASDGETTYPEGSVSLLFDAEYGGLYQQEIEDVGGDLCEQQSHRGCYGVGATPQLSFELYLSIFHVQGPTDPSEYSAAPEGSA